MANNHSEAERRFWDAAAGPAVANQVLFSAAQSCPAPSDGLDTRTAN